MNKNTFEIWLNRETNSQVKKAIFKNEVSPVTSVISFSGYLG